MKRLHARLLALTATLAIAALFGACAHTSPEDAVDTGYTAIRSELLYSARYFDEVETLSLALRSGDLLDYHQVPRALFEQLLAAEDKDAFYRDHLQGKFGEKKVEF